MPKRMTKADKEHALHHVEGNQAFFMSNGRVVSSLQQLGNELADMHEAVYRYHVNDNNNDFANWIKDVLWDEKLAADVLKCKNPAAASKKIAARIKFLSK